MVTIFFFQTSASPIAHKGEKTNVPRFDYKPENAVIPPPPGERTLIYNFETTIRPLQFLMEFPTHMITNSSILRHFFRNFDKKFPPKDFAKS